MGSGSIPTTTGTYYFVNSATTGDSIGSAGNDGKSPQSPLATVQQAIDKCTAGKGDVIILMPGHAETVTATSIALNKSGVSVVGLGQGLLRPTFTYGAAAATVTVSAANCSWSNTHHIANFLDVASAFTIGAAKDFKLDGNTFYDNSSILNFLVIVTTGATNNDADGLTLTGNRWGGLAATSGAFVSILANERRLYVADNVVNKVSTNNAGQFITLSSKLITDAYIGGNRLTVTGAAGTTVGVFLTGSGTTSTGLVEYNRVASLDTTGALIATANTGLYYIENYYTGALDASGAVWPTADNPA